MHPHMQQVSKSLVISALFTTSCLHAADLVLKNRCTAAALCFTGAVPSCMLGTVIRPCMGTCQGLLSAQKFQSPLDRCVRLHHLSLLYTVGAHQYGGVCVMFCQQCNV